MRQIILIVTLILHSSLFTLHLNAQNPQKGDYFLYCHMSDKGQWTAFAVSKDAELGRTSLAAILSSPAISWQA